MHELNIPEVVAEVQAAFDRYEHALVHNEVDVLCDTFWRSPHTLRYGQDQNFYGWDQITSFRQNRSPVSLARTLNNLKIVTFGRDYAVANTEFIRGGRQGRQSQTWLRTDQGWKVVSAHVSWMTA